jgi:ABC-type branched-subunit amino acid transport system ATPase component
VILEVDGLEAGYGEVTILHGVSLRVPRGSIVSVIGPNGAGKSTLLKALYGIVRPHGGTVRFDARDVTGLPAHELTGLGLNYVPQLANVFPNMSVRENLEVGASLLGRRRRAAIDRVLEAFPLLAERRRQRAATLSGGQRKLLALGRALVTDPVLLLLDEPSAGLSPQAVDDVFGTIRRINEGGVSLVIVEQNARRSLALSELGYVLDMGRNRYEGPGRQLLHDPKIAELYLGGARTASSSTSTSTPGGGNPAT